MTKAKEPDRSIVDAILKAKLKGFRRVPLPVSTAAPASQESTPDLSSLRSKTGTLPQDARLTRNAAEILKKNLGGSALQPDSVGFSENGDAAPDDDIEMAAIRPDRESTDEPTQPKTVVIQKSKKKIILRQG